MILENVEHDSSHFWINIWWIQAEVPEFWPNSDPKSSNGSVPRRSNLSTKVDTSCWSKTPAVAAWLKQRNMTPDDGYAYFVKKVAGMVLAETANSLTLQQAENKTEVILRQDILAMKSTGLSLMPEGLEREISSEEMADLLTFLMADE